MIAGGPTGGSRGPGGSGESDPRGGPSSDGPHRRASSSDARGETSERSATAQRDEPSATSAQRAAHSAQGESTADARSSAADARSSARAATGGERSPFDALRGAIAHGIEAAGYVETLLRVRKDRAQLALRNTITMVVAGLLAATAIIALILGGVVLLVAGVSQSFTHAFGDRQWLGNLVGGAVILAVIALAAWIATAWIARRELARKIAEYADLERRHAERASVVGPARAKSAQTQEEPAAKQR